ncbi:AAA family ATPase [Chitinimonas lacunae]|uniref:AAA family ATPase n=1 Tax=Chitinimonas lacunae TaxID=1963018 RepID=A0ABV8MQ15_9NEIS
MLSTQYLIDIILRRELVEDFSAYPFALDAVRELDRLRLHRAVTFFVGENGSGKSTLLEAIAVAWGFNPEGGSRNFNFATHASHSPLHRALRLSRGLRKPRDGYFLRAESFYNVASEIDRLDQEGGGPPLRDSYGGLSLHAQSHGESFFSLLMHRLRGQGLYLFDEPEAALSPNRQLAMLSRLHQLVNQDSQFVIATHSPILLAYPDALIYRFDASGISAVAYEDTEHYKITRDFLNHPRRSLDLLLAPDEP